MSTADGRDDTELVRPVGSLWGRREFVSALGAGGVTAWGFRGLPQPRAPISIVFHGVLVVTKGEGGAFEILMPNAHKSTKIYRHLDSVPARWHQAWLYNSSNQGVELKHEFARTHLTMDAGGDLASHDFSAMFDLDRITDSVARRTELRPYLDSNAFKAHYIGRVTIKGGRSLQALHHGGARTGIWTIPGTDITKTGPANSIVWDTGVDALDVLRDGQLLVKLESSKHFRVQVGNLPRDPADWDSELPVEDQPGPDFVDHDFKWLYRILVPKGEGAKSNPWKAKLKDKMLPAPAFVDWTNDAGVGTPTCFGGCFGC